MNATLFNGGKVHQVSNGATRCGVGKHRTPVQWQMELGDVTCRRCVKLGLRDQQKAGAGAPLSGVDT